MGMLVLNAGSSTLKFSLFDDSATNRFCHGMVDWNGQTNTANLIMDWQSNQRIHLTADRVGYGDAASWVIRSLAEHQVTTSIERVGHRIVHGGTQFHEATLIDEQVKRRLEEISELAPLHNPPALAVLAAMRSLLPSVPQVAVFDTSFFINMPPSAAVYPLPWEWQEQYGIRRFGFHGISHSDCAARAGEILARSCDAPLRLISCHLGNGCSATAIRGNCPVTTTMGFTPLEGLMMGTRSGSIDPGILIHQMQRHDFTAGQLDNFLNRQSGLLGVSGVSSDFRLVQQAAEAGNFRAQLAIKMFADRIRASIGALAVTLGGVDALTFTAGIGEHSAMLRQAVCEGLQCLGIQLDTDRNHQLNKDADMHDADMDIATPSSAARIFVLPAREETVIARETRRVCTG